MKAQSEFFNVVISSLKSGMKIMKAQSEFFNVVISSLRSWLTVIKCYSTLILLSSA